MGRDSGLPEAVSGRRLRHGPSEAAEVALEVAPRCVSEALVLPRLIGSWRNKSSRVKVIKMTYPPTRATNTIEWKTKQRKEKHR